MHSVLYVTNAISSESSLTPLYYLLSIIAVVAAGMWSIWKYMSRQRAKWVAEGAHQENLAKRITDNITATTANTKATDKLTEGLRDFITAVNSRFSTLDTEVTGLKHRLGRVESRVDNALIIRGRAPDGPPDP